MSDQPAPPPPPPTLDKKHDAETLAALATVRDDLKTVAAAKEGALEALKVLDAATEKTHNDLDTLEAHLGVRISGDLRPRVLAFMDTTAKQEKRLVVAEKALGITPPKS